MSESSVPLRARRKWQRRRVKIGVACFYLFIAGMLIWYELRDQGYFHSDSECTLRSTPQGDDWVTENAYPWILAHMSPGGSGSGGVSVVAIESGLETFQQNVCIARGLTADLLTAIAAQKPAVIAIDKFYGQTACASSDKDTQSLYAVTSKLGVPLIVGESTHAAPEGSTEACLVLTPQLDLGSAVKHGLTRLNLDVLKIPMSWPVFKDDSAKELAAPPDDESFSVVTANAAAKVWGKSAAFDGLIHSTQQPYANVRGTLQRQTATNLLCSAPGGTLTAAKWGLMCPAKPQRIDLRNKVVVLGAESESDFPVVLGSGMYGFELQAHYIDALLAQGYLRPVSLWFLLFPLTLYYCLSELLIPYMHIRHHLPWPLFHIDRPLMWTVGVFAVTFVFGAFVPLAFHRFPPLPMLVGLFVILVPRLLIESWALLNEQSEEEQEEHRA